MYESEIYLFKLKNINLLIEQITCFSLILDFPI